MPKIKDIISEEDFTANMLSNKKAVPENDSPGDSKLDVRAEYEMGLEFDPAEDVEDENEEFDESEETDY